MGRLYFQTLSVLGGWHSHPYWLLINLLIAMTERRQSLSPSPLWVELLASVYFPDSKPSGHKAQDKIFTKHHEAAVENKFYQAVYSGSSAPS